ncbi:MAG TPA: hypothetical protein PLV45_17945, partial [bacterium]|nr:hypothetical protein [bacterium]
DTPPPTGTVPPSPTPTGEPTEISVTLNLSESIFHAGDTFLLECDCYNPGYDAQVDRYIILDVYGLYFFWPSWGPVVDHDTCNLTGGTHSVTEIMNFVWPSGINQSAQGIHFWAGLMWPGTNMMAADIASVTFGYE